MHTWINCIVLLLDNCINNTNFIEIAQNHAINLHCKNIYVNIIARLIVMNFLFKLKNILQQQYDTNCSHPFVFSSSSSSSSSWITGILAWEYLLHYQLPCYH